MLSKDGGPPADALDSCGWGGTLAVSSAVYVHGTLTLTYTGAVPDIVTFGLGGVGVIGVQDGTPLQVDGGNRIAIQGSDGSWGECSQTPWLETLNPGQTLTLDMWANLSIIGNSHPTFTAADRKSMIVTVAARGADQGGAGVTAALTGPGAVDCGGLRGFLLYSTPPYHARDVSCTRIR
jgi:hypothetical protein